MINDFFLGCHLVNAATENPLNYNWLLGGLEHFFIFPFHICDVILPIDELIFFQIVIAPPTSWCSLFFHLNFHLHRGFWIATFDSWRVVFVVPKQKTCFQDAEDCVFSIFPGFHLFLLKYIFLEKTLKNNYIVSGAGYSPVICCALLLNLMFFWP